MRYCQSPFFYHAAPRREVVVGDPAHGGVIIGGDHPVVKQSMLTCDTMDTAECVKQTLELVAAGCQIVRITAPTRQGRGQPQEHRGRAPRPRLPRAASSPTSISSPTPPWKPPDGSRWCASTPATTPTRRNSPCEEYSDEQYAAELARIEEEFTPLVKLCKQLGPRHAHRHQPRLLERPHHEPVTATPRWAWSRAPWNLPASPASTTYHNFKFSMKSSNPKVMIECYRLLVARLDGTGAGLELPHPPGRHRGRRRRGWPHQERHRHRLAPVRRPGRHHPRLADGRFPPRNRRLPRPAGANSNC